ncbi:hypothetical protein ABG768_023937 [Culter alburnus]|uniref:Uncharacterized protein n=1 Tax=Culter alburnus TaxID=194366 RepID=A0AAW2AHY2_CULAL
MKSKITKEYNRQVCLALSADFVFGVGLAPINNLAVPVPTYSFGIVHWRVKEIKKMDRKTRKLLMVHGMHHPKADADRLYIKRRDCGLGFIELESAYKIAIVYLNKYIKIGSDKFMKMVKKHKASQTKYSQHQERFPLIFGPDPREVKCL